MEALYGKAVPSVVSWELSDWHDTQPGDWADWVSPKHSIFKGCIRWAVWWRCKRDKLRGTSRGRCGWAENTEQSGKFPPEKTPKAASTQAASREKSCLLPLVSGRLKAALLAKRGAACASNSSPVTLLSLCFCAGMWFSRETGFSIFRSDTLQGSCCAMFLCFPPVHQYLGWGREEAWAVEIGCLQSSAFSGWKPFLGFIYS